MNNPPFIFSAKTKKGRLVVIVHNIRTERNTVSSLHAVYRTHILQMFDGKSKQERKKDTWWIASLARLVW